MARSLGARFAVCCYHTSSVSCHEHDGTTWLHTMSVKSIYTPEAEEFRRRVRQFMSTELGPDWHGIGSLDPDHAGRFVEEWRNCLYQNGFLGLNWPTEYGGQGKSNFEVVVFAEECAKYGVPTGTYSDVFSIKLFGNTLLRRGDEEQKRYFLPRILSGADRW